MDTVASQVRLVRPKTKFLDFEPEKHGIFSISYCSVIGFIDTFSFYFPTLDQKKRD